MAIGIKRFSRLTSHAALALTVAALCALVPAAHAEDATLIKVGSIWALSGSDEISVLNLSKVERSLKLDADAGDIDHRAQLVDMIRGGDHAGKAA